MREWMKEARTRKGLTQLQVAKELDMSEGYYSYIESGSRQKSMDVVLATKLAKVFDMQVQQIIELEAASA